ncbi:MAG TPA: amidohydrolase family protein [Xanthobacteraceae bacterium]|jgi:predicted TIM-barrel fold metal-dependent hydrolase
MTHEREGSPSMIVDAQVHLWKAESPDWPWVPGRKPQLPEPFTIEKLVAMMDEAGVDRVVIVPPSWPGDRNDYAIEAAKRYPTRFGIMGRIPVEKPQSASLLANWREQPGMLGVRLTFHRAQAALLEKGSADWFWPAAEQAGLPVMFLAPGNSSRFAPIAERHPGLQLIIDHMNLTVEIAQERKIKPAIDEVVALAKFPNISVKVSSTPTYSLESYPWRDMTEHIKRCFDAFGPQRCYWGTDITNAFNKSTYRQRITHFTQELKFLSEKDKEWVMGRAILERLKWK